MTGRRSAQARMVVRVVFRTSGTGMDGVQRGPEHGRWCSADPLG